MKNISVFYEVEPLCLCFSLVEVRDPHDAEEIKTAILEFLFEVVGEDRGREDEYAKAFRLFYVFGRWIPMPRYAAR